MPFVQRPDSWIIVSGSTGPRNKTATVAANNDDALSDFASETSSKVIVVPRAPIAARASRNDVAITDTRIQNLTAHRARNVRLLPTRTALISFACGAAASVLITWLTSAQLPSTIVPSTTQALIPETTSPPDLPASPADARPSSVVPAPVGTSGRTGAPNQAVSSSRAGSAPAARRRNASSASYRGSLAFRSAPQGARVFVNGALVGSTPLVLENLPVGSRAVRIEADGYQRWSAATQVVADRQTRISATLTHADP